MHGGLRRVPVRRQDRLSRFASLPFPNTLDTYISTPIFITIVKISALFLSSRLELLNYESYNLNWANNRTAWAALYAYVWWRICVLCFCLFFCCCNYHFYSVVPHFRISGVVQTTSGLSVQMITGNVIMLESLQTWSFLTITGWLLSKSPFEPFTTNFRCL